jgi:DNA invertase Pin-like site-specific DNA recombinase
VRAGIYCRISSDPKGLRAGVERQEADCRAFAERMAWAVSEVYVDNDISAYSGKPRPAYDRLLDDVRAGVVMAVVAWHNDRLHRSPVELETFISLVEQTGAAVAVVEGGSYDLTSPDGRPRLALLRRHPPARRVSLPSGRGTAALLRPGVG